jgi:hypothetical protein
MDDTDPAALVKLVNDRFRGMYTIHAVGIDSIKKVIYIYAKKRYFVPVDKIEELVSGYEIKVQECGRFKPLNG